MYRTLIECNERRDCSDGQDEIGCKGSCPFRKQLCDDGRCISKWQDCQNDEHGEHEHTFIYQNFIISDYFLVDIIEQNQSARESSGESWILKVFSALPLFI